MKYDLDRLMRDRALDAIVISGKIYGNPALYYMINGAGLTRAKVIKKRGETPVLIANAMERDEAKAAGLPVELETKYDYSGLLKEHEGDALAAGVAYFLRILADHDVQGSVGFYGMADQGSAYTFLRALQEAASDIEVVGEFDGDIIAEARATKEAPEVARIRDVGRRTVKIVQDTVAFLKHHRVGDDETLRKADGSTLTVGDVHAYIGRQIALQGLEEPVGFIFATGRDAGIPHSKGTLSSPLRLGESVVFDIYPCEHGGGYFFDMTRTFCLGYAPPAVESLYQDVRDCIEHICAAIQVGEEARRYQQMTCEFFKQRGHPTVAENPGTLEGYVHGVSHGVGLDLHERPMFRDVSSNTTTLQPGHVFTVEPGLYYPERGMGCRLEDVVWIDEEGTPHNLTDYPYDLVIPL